MKKQKKQDLSESLKTLQTASSLGFAIIIPMVFGAFLGVFLDKTLGTKPVLTLVLILLGTLIGIAAGIKTIKEII